MTMASISKSLGVFKCPICSEDGSLLVRLRKTVYDVVTEVYFIHRRKGLNKWCKVEVDLLSDDLRKKVQEVIEELKSKLKEKQELITKREVTLNTITSFIYRRLKQCDNVTDEFSRIIAILKGLVEVEKFYRQCVEKPSNECYTLGITTNGWSFNALNKFVGDYVAPAVIKQLEECGIIKTTYRSKRYHYWRANIDVETIEYFLNKLEKEGVDFLQQVLHKYLKEDEYLELMSKLVTTPNAELTKLTLILYTWLITKGTFDLRNIIQPSSRNDVEKLKKMIELVERFIKENKIRVTILEDKFLQRAFTNLRTVIAQNFNVKAHKVIEGRKIVKIVDERFRRSFEQVFHIVLNFVNRYVYKVEM